MKIVIFLGALAGVVGWAACDSAKPAPATLVPVAEAVPPDSLRSCEQDGDCIKVETSCNGCCEQAAVNASSADAYRNHKTNVCTGYAGPICNCAFQPARVVCIQKKCTVEGTDGG